MQDRISRRSVLLGIGGAAMTSLLDLPSAGSQTARPVKIARLPRAAPESVGVWPDAIAAFIDDVEKSVGGLHSFMLLRHGKVAAEGWWTPYAPQLPHQLYSLSKSFTSTAVGLAIADGKLTIEDKVTSFFPDRLPARIDDNLAAMRVKHLLTMNTGHDQDATGPTTAAADGDWVRAFLALSVQHAPGTKFVYNSAATYMLSAIVQKLTGERVVDFLTPRLFDPLGIIGQTWETCPKGINCGGWGLSVKTEDIARFGQLYLQGGTHNGQQLVPTAWVEQATSKQVSNGEGGESDWTQGYGYQFWRCRHNAFRGDGAFGQYCVVMPDMDAVLAITSGVGDMQAVLNAVWDHLLPGMQQSGVTGERDEALRQRIAQLEVHAPQGTATNAMGKRVSGKRYRLAANNEGLNVAEFGASADRCTLTLRGEAAEYTLPSGNRGWIASHAPAPSPPGLSTPRIGKVACRGAWTADDSYAMVVCYIETPYVETVTCRFSGEGLAVTRKFNVAFGPTERPTLTGTAG